MQKLLRAGVPADKIVIGVPFYGRSVSGVEDSNHGLHAPFTGTGPGSYEDGMLDYKDIKGNYLDKEGYSYFWDDVAQVPFLHNPAKKIFISFDDVDSISLKGWNCNSPAATPWVKVRITSQSEGLPDPA